MALGACLNFEYALALQKTHWQEYSSVFLCVLCVLCGDF